MFFRTFWKIWISWNFQARWVENLSDGPRIVHGPFFYINPEFETGGAGIWKKKLNLGTPTVRSCRAVEAVCSHCAQDVCVTVQGLCTEKATTNNNFAIHVSPAGRPSGSRGM